MFDNILEVICLHCSPVLVFFLHRTSSCFLQIISREGFWRAKFARDGLLCIPLERKESVIAWLIEYNRRRNAKTSIKGFKSGDGSKYLTLEEVASLGITDIKPIYSRYHCELFFYRRPKRNLYVYHVNVVRDIIREPGGFYHDVKQTQPYRREVGKKEFYQLLFLYYYKIEWASG
ncbi:Hypothetical protein BRZCDTV_502 [Brazilian cedratvirus IHUMI]|uniref:Uncharacterized protein n=1 Tax=Brazilian cedratvirus IHUMI TaxID=2126980 RepID=A0A2R8FFM1_9VIRU|nr:Hypothetical protein BRZCDTV_502 [Brazilian cedratvirus IHUMI]